MEIGFMVSLVSITLAAATFFIGRQSSAKSSGHEWGELKTDIKYIKNDMQEIKSSISDNNQDIKLSIRRLHKRIDEHEEKYHDRIITRNDDAEV